MSEFILKAFKTAIEVFQILPTQADLFLTLKNQLGLFVVLGMGNNTN